MLGFGGLLKRNGTNPDGFELEQDYENLKRVNPYYEKLPNSAVKGSELDNLLKEYAKSKKNMLELSLPERIEKKPTNGFFLSGVYETTLELEPMIEGTNTKAFEKYNEHRFKFEMDDNRYTFDTVVLGKTGKNLYIAKKPSFANEETVPYKGFKTKPPAKPKFNGKEVVELGKGGVIFTSRESHPREGKIEGGKLYLPDINLKNSTYMGGEITIPEAVVKYKSPGCTMAKYGVEFTKSIKNLPLPVTDW
ncbi:MAG: hypothetical protein ACOCQX_02205 [Candidatus Nanoarchaeia archaeon]